MIAAHISMKKKIMDLITSHEHIRNKRILGNVRTITNISLFHAFQPLSSSQGRSDNIFKFFLHTYGYGMNKNNDRKQISLISPICRLTSVLVLLSRISKNFAFVFGLVVLVGILSCRLTLCISCSRILSRHHLIFSYGTYQESDKQVYLLSTLY